MAYATKYRFVFDSVAGTSFRIDIQKDGYSGSVLKRRLGQPPHLRRDSAQNGICGTSLDIYAECAVDGEFAEFYTTDARAYKVLVQMYLSGSWTTIWTGFISPELYSEPEIAPLYDVCITAVDGLGELKMYSFPANGRQSLRTHLQTILAYTGLDTYATDIISVSSLRATSPTISAATMLANTYVNLDHLSEGNCYDALQAIMQTLHMTITRYNNKWLLIRDSDVAVSGGAIAAKNASGTSVSLPVAQYNSMRLSRWWPVGKMETEIVPAKKKVTVGYPYRVVESLFTNPETANPYCGVTPVPIGVDDCPGWQSIGQTKSYDSGSAFYGNHAQVGKLQQTITVESQGNYQNPDQMQLVLKLAGIGLLSGPNSAKIRVKVFVSTNSSTGPWLKKKRYADGETDLEWVTTDSSFELTVPVGYYSGPPDLSYTEFPITIPFLPGGNFTIQLDGSEAGNNIRFSVGGVYLTKPTINGYQDVINIDNSARDAESDIELSFGDSPYTANALANILNILSDGSDNLTTEWATAQFTGEFLSVIAMDYALAASLPRLLARGTINVPKDSIVPAAFLNPNGIPMIFNTWDWNLYDDEVDVSMVSIPSSDIQIVDETITQLTDEQAAAYGSGGGKGSGAGTYNPGSGGTQFFEAVEDDEEIVGAKALYDLHIIQEPADEQHGTPEVTKNISEILRHLALQVVDEGLETERTILVTDLTFASQHNIIAGGIGGGEDPGGEGTLATLADVALGTLAAGDILHYNATTSHWVNVQPTLALLTDVALGTPTDGQALIWDATLGKWRPGTVASTGGIASVGLTMPEGFSVAGSPLMSDGTLAVTFARGYSLPTDTKQAHWDAAYGWGNHASAGYMLASDFTAANIVSTLGRTAVNRASDDSHGNTIASQTWVGQQGFLTSVTFGDLTSHPTTLFGYGITDAYISGGTITLGNNSLTPITSLAFGDLTSHPTTLAGYGITDAKISRGTITLGSNTITPLTSVSVSSAGAEIGTSLTVIGTVEGVEIKAKIASYLLSADFTAANIVSTLGNTAVNRAIADGSGNSFGTSYLRKDTDDTMAAHLTVGTSGSRKTLTLYGSTSAALTIYGSSYYTNIYRNSSGLQLSSNIVVDGNITATGNILAGSASDRRLKRDIKAIDINAASGVLEALRPVQFTWNEKARELGGFSGDSRGFIADEYNDIIPNATRKIWGEYDAIDYIQTIPYLVAGWQAQNLRIRILEGEIRVLKGDNEMMRRRLREHNVLL